MSSGRGSGKNTIGRANRDGTHVIHDFITLPVGWFMVRLAASSTHLYWAVRGKDSDGNMTPIGRIGRANLDGTGVNNDFMNVPNTWTGLAVTNNYIFYNDDSPNIKRANLDGTNAQVFIAGVESSYFAAHGDMFYWINPYSEPINWIGRVKENGANLDPDFLPISGSYPAAIAVDSKFFYWSSYESNDQRAAYRAPLDGSTGAIELFLNVGGGGIAVEPD